MRPLSAQYYQLHSFFSSQAAAAVEKATIEPMVAKPPNNNAVQMIRVFMAVLLSLDVTTAEGNFEVRKVTGRVWPLVILGRRSLHP